MRILFLLLLTCAALAEEKLEKPPVIDGEAQFQLASLEREWWMLQAKMMTVDQRIQSIKSAFAAQCGKTYDLKPNSSNGKYECVARAK